jgi:hypothetical protein
LQESPDVAGEVALEAADGFAGALALAADFRRSIPIGPALLTR